MGVSMTARRTALALFLIGVLIVPAAYAARVKPNLSFFSGAQDDAHWTPRDSADPANNRMSIELEVGPLASGGAGYAGVYLNRAEGLPAPTAEPYFWHREDRDSPLSGGSPRMSIIYPNGRLDLRPDEWSTEWRQVGGPDEFGDKGNWDATGGNCGFLYDVEYSQARACFGEAPVSSVIVVTDSNWMPDKADGYQNWVDRIQYAGYEFSAASDNSNAPAVTQNAAIVGP